MENPSKSNVEQGAPASERTNATSIASLAVGIGSGFVPVLAGVAAIILGHVALGQIKRERTRGRKLAIAGIVLGWLNILVAILAAAALAIAVHSAQPSPAEKLDSLVKSDVRATVTNIVQAEASNGSNAKITVSDPSTQVVVIIADQVTVASGRSSAQGAVPGMNQTFKVCGYNPKAQTYRADNAAYGYDSETGFFKKVATCG